MENAPLIIPALHEREQPGLYIHIPYCRTKCQYCSFISYPRNAGNPDYLQALIQRIHDLAGDSGLQTWRFATIFIGGGTPTIYDGNALALLLRACFANFKFTERPEITIESNPNTISFAKLRQCRAAGINRLSIGVQTFANRLLGLLGRSHSDRDALKAFSAARRAGFNNINLDFMYGLPGQTLTNWQQTIKTGVALEPEHLSLYELSIEKGTPFARAYSQGLLNLPNEEQIMAMTDFAYPFLAKHGYIRYEISSFAKEGFFCRHNLNYWRNGSYLGLGAGAVSCFSGLRLTNTNDPALYTKMAMAGRDSYTDSENLTNEASFRESVIMGLRMLDGVSLARLRARYGINPQDYYGARLQLFIDQGMINMDNKSLKLTARALPVANQILAELV
ncbi:MAG: radical SAM family heme chaperone HemW [Deltaproteobacteria bacterium]|nr:radical SAM family heme chaperone HemW [Deltaproteobacteria bacterium]